MINWLTLKKLTAGSYSALIILRTPLYKSYLPSTREAETAKVFHSVNTGPGCFGFLFNLYFYLPFLKLCLL